MRPVLCDTVPLFAVLAERWQWGYSRRWQTVTVLKSRVLQRWKETSWQLFHRRKFWMMQLLLSFLQQHLIPCATLLLSSFSLSSPRSFFMPPPPVSDPEPHVQLSWVAQHRHRWPHQTSWGQRTCFLFGRTPLHPISACGSWLPTWRKCLSSKVHDRPPRHHSG